MGYTIKVINGKTMERIETTMLEHNDTNVMQVARKYEGYHGKLTDIDFSSDCLILGKYADGMTLGFSI